SRTDGADRAPQGADRPDGDADGWPRFDWERSAEHCRIAYLRGRFLARGSLSFASSQVHLEFVVSQEEAPVLAGWLADLALPASWRVCAGPGWVCCQMGGEGGSVFRGIGGAARGAGG